MLIFHGIMPDMSGERMSGYMGFLHETEGLKRLLRHSWLSDGRQESVAEHTWRLTLMAMTIGPELGVPVDMAKTLQMLVIHDLGEIHAGDHHAFNARPTDRYENERAGLMQVVRDLPPERGQTIINLWEEFETGETHEAKFARALDKIEVLVQHNEADLTTWNEKERDTDFNLIYGDEHCSYNEVLLRIKNEVRVETRKKLDLYSE